ncbi:agamous-like MADS-box protein AGL29 [Argentina anserina]|uniref:agamous-like MADS-box protein AGL29 n=1 Tax=Argentina anserina TaxID=57926 RepID=UPI0021762647|nr:agamous-like MADS-box protein AGL29 [Potentilla anserina]
MAKPDYNNVQSSPVDVLNNTNALLPPPSVKKTKGRRRVEIKKVEAASNRHVTFSKRKKGLFNKAAELSLLTGAETAAIVVSGNGRMFGFGSSSCEDVIHRYLADSNSQIGVESDRRSRYVNSAHLAKLRQQLLEARRQLEEEKKRATMIQQRKQAAGVAVPAELWWEEEMMDQTPEELQSYSEALHRLKSDVERRAQQKILNVPCSYTSLMDGRVVMGENYINNSNSNMNTM